MKELEKSAGKTPKDTEISNLPDKEFKEMILRLLTKLECGLEEFRGNFHKELKGYD